MALVLRPSRTSSSIFSSQASNLLYTSTQVSSKRFSTARNSTLNKSMSFRLNPFIHLSSLANKTQAAAKPWMQKASLNTYARVPKTKLVSITKTQSAGFSTSKARMTSNSDAFMSAVHDRRTFYALNSSSPIPDSKIQSLAEQAILDVPSSFNAQSARLVLLFDADHLALWSDIVLASLIPLVKSNPDALAATTKKIKGFAAAHGTILFFEDSEPVDALVKAAPLYADKFPQWSEHTSAMHQFVLWTALEAEGLGVNLQHYNPLIDSAIKEKWGVPQNWNLVAQMVYGGKVDKTPAGGEVKEQKKSLEERVKIFGASL
jgi:predicted oxidoreductase (fatty acid repression mutant protein)